MKEDIEEPIKKSPLLIASLLLLEVLLIVTGVLLVSWYMDNLEQGIEQASLNRVLISGVAVLVFIILLTVILINLLGKQRKASKSGRRSTSTGRSTTTKRATSSKKTVSRASSRGKATSKRTTKK
jgi:uncharacterized membrane protein